MVRLSDIRSLSDFQRNTKHHLRRLKATGRPAVLTVNGHAEIVVQSAEAYQQLLEDHDLLDCLRGITRGLEQIRRGEGKPMRAVLQDLAKRHGVSLAT